MATLSVDLAYKDYSDIGVVILAKAKARIVAHPLRLAKIGLRGQPSVRRLSEAFIGLAEDVGAEWIFIDGPQGWKAPDNGCEHARRCERLLATQGKTGLPKTTKPANYVGFISFSIELFDAIAAEGWPRLPSSNMPPSRTRCSVESFPTSAWRSLDISPLPGKAAASSDALLDRLRALRRTFPLDVPDDLSHDELQALVAGLAGIALEAGNRGGVEIVGFPPREIDGTWREGFIVNPTRRAAV